jgi:pimeloyl-ACP methyl ester carboxylesterase
MESQATVACPSCRTESALGSAFCSRCGNALSTPTGETTLVNPTAAGDSVPARGASGLATGAVLKGKYRLVELLGRGGMGVVWKAEDLRLKRTVALKFLSHEWAGEAEARGRFVREAQAASELDHPNVCTVFEVDETPAGQMYIAMAYYKGESLKERLARGPLPLAEAVDVAVQLARGLEAAHAHDIVHRDIKPANILVGEGGLPKIVDFGLAKLSDATQMTRTGATMGTAAYMSPEQAQGKPTDRRTDLWSLGAVFYEMLTGVRPFAGTQQTAVLYNIVHERATPPRRLDASIPPEVERVVLRALEKKPEARYATAAAIAADLEAYRESVRIAETGAFDLRRVLRRAARPAVAAPALAILLAIGALGGWLYDRQQKIRWARDVALPEIERLAEANNVWRDLTPAYDLAVKAEAVVPDDPKLAALLAKVSVRPSIRTEPPGAKVYVKEYAKPDAEWSYLGVTPLEKIRLPVGIFRFRLDKEGYEPVLAAASTWNIDIEKKDLIVPYDLERTLDTKASLPPGMVRVPRTETPDGVVEAFFIDRHEVTNAEFKAFVDAGGYRDRKYWKQPFVLRGRTLAWEEALSEFVDASGRPGPSTWQAGDHPDGQASYPVSGVSWYEAAAYAEFAGKALPTAQHWSVARGQYTPILQFPQLGGDALIVPVSNVRGKGPVAVESLQGITAFGAYDMAGNVREWCWNETPNGRCVRGGAWDDNTYAFGYTSQAPPMDRSAKNGFRCALYPDAAKVPPAALAALPIAPVRDVRKEAPVSDAVFEAYRERFAYDRTPLDTRVEASRESPSWIHETVSFDAAYGRERVLAHLFLPRNAKPPFQAVIYFPGSASAFQRSSKEIESYYEFPMFVSFIVKSGRALLYPVYKGTFERADATTVALLDGNETRAYTEFVAQQVKDYRRSVDFLESRKDIDGARIAFYGMSWGATMGPLITAVDLRARASILIGAALSAGFDYPPVRPEADPASYLRRSRTPTLILNGLYDVYSDVETNARPMFELLGAPPEHKQLKLYETDHIPPRNEFVKETLAWLDRYLGPVQ